MIDLRASPTRAEVIGWSLAGPLLVALVLVVLDFHGSIGSMERHYRPIEDELGPTARLVLTMGDAVITTVLLACALLPVAALLTRQRPWVHLAAPFVCGALAVAVLVQVSAALVAPAADLTQHYRAEFERLSEQEPPPPVVPPVDSVPGKK